MGFITKEELLKQYNLDENETKQEIETSSSITPGSSPIVGIPQEVIDFTNDRHNIQDHIVDEEPSTGQVVAGTGAGVAVELGLGFGATYGLSKSTSYAKHISRVANAVKVIKNAGRGTAAIGAGAGAIEPISTVGSLAFLGITEATAWGLSNYAGQSVRVATGAQDAIHSSELMAASLFGIVARPVESLQVIDNMGKAINKSLPLTFESGNLLTMKAWKGRELLVKGAPRFVSGASLGIAESAFRQEMALLMGDQDQRNTYDYLFSAGFGGTFNSLFHVFNKTGAWGRQQASTLSGRASNRTKEALETINEQLKTATRGKKRQLLKQKREHETALAMIEDFGAKIDQQAKLIDNNANQEVKQPLPDILKERQLNQPKNTDLSYKELQARAKVAGIKANQKKQTLIDELDKRQQTLNQSEADKLIDELQVDYNLVKKDSAYESARPQFTVRGRRIYDAADFDSVNAIERISQNADDIEAVDLLIQSSEIKLKLKDGILGELNNSSGRSVAANRLGEPDLTPTKYSEATELEIDSLTKLIKDLKEYKAGSNSKLQSGIKDKTKANQKLYNSIYDAVYAEAGANQSGKIKFVNSVRTARKLAMVNSITSAQAAIPTGAFEMGRLFVKPLGTFITESKSKGLTIGAQLAKQEMLGSAEAYSFLWNKQARQQFFKHIKTTFREGQDPNYKASTKFSDEQGQMRLFKYGTEREILRKAKADVSAQSKAQGNLISSSNKIIAKGAFVDFMSLGARAIMATDAGFKRQLRIAAAKTKARQKAIIAHPNDPDKAVRYADELYTSWTKDRNGLEVLDGEAALASEFADIDNNLLMTATSSDIDGAEKNVIEKIFIENVDKYLKTEGVGRNFGILVEAIMPFYKIGVRSVSRGIRFADPLNLTSLNSNPYKKPIKDLKLDLKTQEASLRTHSTNGNTEAAKRKAVLIKSLRERLELLEVRQLNFNKERITDAVVGSGLLLSGFTMGLNGDITGTNAWMTPEQKKNNPNVKSFKIFGADYRAGVPFNLALAIGADIGAYFRIRRIEEEKRTKILAPNRNLLSVFADSFFNTMKELPLHEGLRQLDKITDSEARDRLADIKDTAIKLATSYVPIPSQAKKFYRYFDSPETINDLRAGTFGERTLYHLLGKGVGNKKLNSLGEPLKNTRGFEFTINRFAVEKSFKPTLFEKAKQSDHYNHIPDLPQTFEGINTTKLLDKDGLTFKTRFAQRLRGFEIKGKTLNEAVTSFLTGDIIEYQGEKIEYFEAINQNRTNIDGTYDNKGLKVLGSIIRKYYRETEKELLKDEGFLNQFVNEKDENLLKLISVQETNEEDNDGFVEGRSPIGIEPYFKK